MSSKFFPVHGKIFVVAVYYMCEHQTMRYCFVGKNFVVRLSTTKTMKILPPKNIRYTVYETGYAYVAIIVIIITCLNSSQ